MISNEFQTILLRIMRYIYDLEYPWTIIGIILHQLSTTLCANDLRSNFERN